MNVIFYTETSPLFFQESNIEVFEERKAVKSFVAVTSKAITLFGQTIFTPRLSTNISLKRGEPKP